MTFTLLYKKMQKILLIIGFWLSWHVTFAFAQSISCPSPVEVHAGKTSCVVSKPKESKENVGLLSKVKPTTLKQVVTLALERHPQILAARGRVREAMAGIDVAKANGRPQLEGNYGFGYGGLGQTSEPLMANLFDQTHLTKQLRNELSLSGKQLIFDFGSTESGILRAVSLKKSEDYNLATKIDEIALSVSDAYVKVVEARELSRLNKDNIEALQRIQDLVIANQENGNGTIADVKRVEARLVDAKTVAADTEAELQNAMDRFRRLVREEPGALKPVPILTSFIPKSPILATEILPHSSVHLLSIDASIRGIEYELKSKRQGGLPQVILQMDTTSKFFSGQMYKNDFDARAMLTMSYKFIDGGLANAQLEQIYARLDQEQRRYDFDRDEAEADLRQFFNSIDAARGKSRALAEGVDASAKARELYTEQFRGGKRTLFELLDIQTAYFNASRNQIMNFFEEQRSVYAVLKTLGMFTQVVMNAKLPDPKEELVTNSIGNHVPFPEPLVDWRAPEALQRPDRDGEH